jgi:5'-deoxynucleotidase YfbR-like HD superfamily hydrolase
VTELSALLIKLDAALKAIGRIVDEKEDLIERAIRNAATDRVRMNVIATHEAVENVKELHASYVRLIDERETLAKALESIRGELENLGIDTKAGKP